MLKFTKKRTDISGQETGDFYAFDASVLYDLLKPLSARCDTAEVEITVYPIDDKVELDEKAIREVILTHGSQAEVDKRAKQKEIDEYNKPIKAEIESLDKKRIRPLAESDAAFLKSLNEQIIALRGKLK
jgi:hypothetical protein